MRCTGPDLPPPPQLKRSPSGEADKDGSEAGDSPASNPGAADAGERDSAAPGEQFDFERILEDFVLLTFLVRIWQGVRGMPLFCVCQRLCTGTLYSAAFLASLNEDRAVQHWQL